MDLTMLGDLLPPVYWFKPDFYQKFGSKHRICKTSDDRYFLKVFLERLCSDWVATFTRKSGSKLLTGFFSQ
jgi:hypothetical protein